MKQLVLAMTILGVAATGASACTSHQKNSNIPNRCNMESQLEYYKLNGNFKHNVKKSNFGNILKNIKVQNQNAHKILSNL